jgi:hypothetical protein
MVTTKRLTVALVLLTAMGCGGDAGPDCSKVMTLSVDPSQTVVSLSQEQRRELCDHSACLFGGYGARLSCRTESPVTISANQRACISTTPTNPECLATVQDYLGCMEAIRADPCTSTLFSNPACFAVTDFACLTLTAAAVLMVTAPSPGP